MSGIVGANFTKESGLKRSHKFQRFTADGTWVKPSGITTVRIECIGGGGGGGADAGGGGAGASITSGTYNAASLPATLTVAVGGGGNGAPAYNVQGAAGTLSTVTADSKIILAAYGGGGAESQYGASPGNDWS